MPLTRIIAGDQMKAVNVNQIIDALDGASGAGVPISLTAVSDATNFALTVQNDEPTNSRALNVLDASGNVMIRVDAGGVTLGGPLSVPDGSITSAMIADGTIVPSDLAPGAVTSQAVGGDLNGTVGNARLVVQTGSAINWRDSGGTEHPFISFAGEQLFWASTGGGFRWVSQGNSAEWMRLDTSGNLTTAAGITSGTVITSNGLLFSQNGYGWAGIAGVTAVETAGAIQVDGGLVYFHANRSIFLQASGTSLVAGGFTQLSLGGNVVFSTNANQITWPGGESITAGESQPGGHNSAVYLSPHAFVFFDFGVGHTITCQNLVQTSDPRAKSSMQVLTDTDCMGRVRNPGISVYTYQLPPPAGGESADGAPVPTPTDIGFDATEVYAGSPEFAALSEGHAVGVNYSNMAALLWGALRDLDARCQAKGI
jgi:hypothetical protein